jgi:hypothetical protein
MAGNALKFELDKEVDAYRKLQSGALVDKWVHLHRPCLSVPSLKCLLRQKQEEYIDTDHLAGVRRACFRLMGRGGSCAMCSEVCTKHSGWLHQTSYCRHKLCRRLAKSGNQQDDVAFSADRERGCA